MEQLRAEFVREIASFDNPDGTYYIIGECVHRQIVCGVVEQPLEQHIAYMFFGKWTIHPKYGRQFAFQNYSVCAPKGQQGTLAYLARCPSIGRRRALAIWNKYGEASVEVARTQPKEIARLLSISEQTAEQVAEFLQSQAENEAATVELMDIFAGHNMPRNIAALLIQDFGSRAPSEVRANPYLLMQYSGIGFKRADAIWLSLGKPPHALRRQIEYLTYIITTNQSGHSWLSVQHCLSQLQAQFGESAATIEQLRESGHFCWQDSPNGPVMTTHDLYEDEETIANAIATYIS